MQFNICLTTLIAASAVVGHSMKPTATMDPSMMMALSESAEPSATVTPQPLPTTLLIDNDNDSNEAALSQNATVDTLVGLTNTNGTGRGAELPTTTGAGSINAINGLFALAACAGAGVALAF